MKVFTIFSSKKNLCKINTNILKNEEKNTPNKESYQQFIVGELLAWRPPLHKRPLLTH